jgi:hypothetical protein
VEVSGIPLKGISKWVKSPRNVFYELFNYHLRIPNIKGTLLSLVANCYDRVKVNNRYLTKGKVYNQLYHSNFSLRYSHGISSPLELREFLTKAGDTTCPLPNENEIPNLFKDLVSQGLVNLSYQSNLESIKMFDRIVKYYNDQNIDDLNV